MYKLSVITVVYNDVKNIRRTMLSVLNQSFDSIEYILIDGKSTDGTWDIIQEYKDKLAYTISEPDKGIYDAMNKGLAVATGEFVLFMNSGDEIYDTDTVKEVFDTSDSGDIYYGETEMYNDNWKSLGRRRHKIPEKFTWRSFKLGMNISHQAIYIKRSITTPYNLQYKYSSDIDWILKAAKKSSNNVNTHRYVAKYLIGGMSKQKHLESLRERFEIFNNHYGRLPNFFNHLIMACKLAYYYILNRRTND